MSRKAATLLWNRQRIALPSATTTDVDTGLTQLSKTFAAQSPNEPTLGVEATSSPAPGTLPSSRVQVIPLAPLSEWTNIDQGEPYFNTTTNTVHVEFTNNNGSPVDVNVLCWNPHTVLGPGTADTYNPFNPCFMPDTLVWTPTGAQPIHTLREGDLVLAWDGQMPQARKVTKVHRHVVDHRRLIETGNDTLIETTDNHPFMVHGKRWAPIGALEVDDVLCGRDGALTLTRSERIDGDVEVMNIEVDDLHTYLVGPRALAVHNK